ncbi:exonuclease domain-containing protein [Roseicyclus marinus]|uniref:exonuclease domain-containing protein n=1 Tax=Roseicyclus marinus TaxID=2161673 RepID=UPI00240F3AA4|nr:exonuclease domain-containing protein [Roseicyclus marinus]MDG3039812.1 exonuclease domain-containing protein [Roseicyclus marinus]
MKYVFYDLETTGLSPEFDQPLQFAAIMTDEDFTEIARVNMRCRLAPHILPSPHALLVTRVSPEEILDPNLPSLLEFAERLSELIERWAPAVWIGYNSMRFDESFLRQTLYQNLLPNIYLTQSLGNARFDLMPAIHAVYLENTNILKWPTNKKGKVIFKLDRLAPFNGFDKHNAHDALGDVEATVHIAKMIASGNAQLWNELLASSCKAHVERKLESFAPQRLVARYGAQEPRAYIGCFCGYSAQNRGEAAFFDIEAADPTDFLDASEEVLFAAVNSSPKIIRSVATSRAPTLLSVGEPSAEQLQRAAVIAAAPEFRERVSLAMAKRYKGASDAQCKQVEERIYEAFYSESDKNLLVRFHDADWLQKRHIVSQFSDSRLRQLGHRLIALYSPDLLSEEEIIEFRKYIRDKWLKAEPSLAEWMTLQKATETIDELRLENKIPNEDLDRIVGFLKEQVHVSTGTSA